MGSDGHGTRERAGMSRRAVLRTGAVTGAAAGSMAVTGTAAAAAPGPAAGGSGGGDRRTSPAGDLILYNGRIHTMDGSGTVASVIAIRDGFIVYVGDSLGAAQHQFTTWPRAIDLRGRMAIPGIIDCHNHIVLMGNRPGHHTPLENAYSIADVQAIYAARAATLPPSPHPPASADDFITTIGGFSPNQFRETRLPTLAELDAAVPGHPVYISAGFTGPSVTNTPGKAFFENVAPPVGPVPVGADGSIAPSGFTTPGPTGQATLALRQTLTFDARKRSVRDAMAYAVSVGVTTHLDQGAFQATNTPVDGSAHENNFTMHLPFLAVYAEGEQRDVEPVSEGLIRLRVNFLLWDSDPAVPIATNRIQNAFPFFGNDLVRTGAAGEFLADPFRYYAGGNQVWMNAALAAARAGWRAEVHSLTPTDFQTEIAGFEAVNAHVPITGLRWVVAHVPFITADYAARLKAVGGGVNLTPYEYFNTANPGGPPYRMLVDSGIPVGLSSDGMQIAPMNPWIHAYYATTGINALGHQINPGQQLTRAEVLEHFTSANRWFLGGQDEDLLGTLEVGRLGDVVVLSEDYFAVADDDLKKLHSVLTVLGGRVVHEGGIRYWA
ncbi:MAG TPA: amidohydrolase family protein [Trebonia sp.]|jgi:predicted amidohydrolase YtcJ|nr:amidohydrolase family protein [Trebonia sp.]